ncbi:MAG TPA: hypothetical protein VFV48_08135, partial [Pseudomonadales bacterium]|nr:hypothetical protein [Pseudomonadales bacterium]
MAFFSRQRIFCRENFIFYLKPSAIASIVKPWLLQVRGVLSMITLAVNILGENHIVAVLPGDEEYAPELC